MEWQCIARAAQALEDAYSSVFAAARPGMTADQIDEILARSLRAHGGELPADKTRSTPYVVDPQGAPPKLRVNRAPLVEGKLWGMDNSIVVDGHWADLGRYGWFGPLPAGMARAYQQLVDRQDQIAAAIRPGVPMGELFRAVPDGLPFEVHRIGREPQLLPFMGNLLAGVTENMRQSDRQGLVFEPGQVICIELWVGLQGGIEDMYRVDEDGVSRISRLPREIRVIQQPVVSWHGHLARE